MQTNIKAASTNNMNKLPHIEFQGIGAHSGKLVTLNIDISPQYSGIIFKINEETIQASWKNVISTHMSTVIGNDHICIATIEHFLSALRALNIYNALIEIDNKELPILDGSSIEFYTKIAKFMEKHHVKTQNTKYIKILKHISIKTDNRFVSLEPSDYSEFTAEMDGTHPHPSKLLKNQTCHFNFTHHSYEKLIAPSRTFGFKQDAQKLYDRNLAKGVSLENTIVIDNDRVLNREGLRHNNEFASHKILDAIGDLALAGKPILGHYKALNGGHTLNYYLLQKLFSDSKNYEIVENI